MRPCATSIFGLKLLVYEASVFSLELLVYETSIFGLELLEAWGGKA